MTDTNRRLILANGESYVQPILKSGKGGPQLFPRTFAEARDHVRNQVGNSLREYAALPDRKRDDDEAVFCLRLHPDKLAKSYDPNGIFGLVRDLQNVGSRGYTVRIDAVKSTKRLEKRAQKTDETVGRLLFVRSNEAGFRRFLRVLDRPEGELPRYFQDEIRSIERFDLLNVQEQVQGFPPNWKEGRVEIVLHPTRRDEHGQLILLRKLFRGLDVPTSKMRIVPYQDGPTFVSCRLTIATLREIGGANPLRTVHPLMFSDLPDLRGAPTFPAPPPPTSGNRSTIRVGIFDGGVDANNPALKGHVEQDDSLSIRTTASPAGISHGTAVAGAALYGAINNLDLKTPLPNPQVSVVSVRVLPTSDPTDVDLFECVDVIEKAVPARPDVKFWNLSVGPRGPILDDSISRFTYALDALASSHKVGFCVAVGNDGDAGPGLHRIQSPSDMVNGLGVGAYTSKNGRVEHAPYSCRGPGRECGKVKPDLVAFGGCSHNLIHLIGPKHGTKALSAGTSFAAPIAAAIGGLAIGTLERGTALLARTLMIHTAKHPDGDPDDLLGHGIVAPSLAELVRCGDKEVTIVFQGELLAGRFVKLPLLLPSGVVASGDVNITYTVAGLPPVSPNHPGDYTALCIEEHFYPHSHRFSFTKKNSKGKMERKTIDIKANAEEARRLREDGWKRSGLPSSDSSGNAYPTEDESRALNYKWEPIVRRKTCKRAASLDEPFLVLHAIARHGTTGRLDYAAAITVSVPSFSGDLYDIVLRKHARLQPVRLRLENELRVQI